MRKLSIIYLFVFGLMISSPIQAEWQEEKKNKKEVKEKKTVKENKFCEVPDDTSAKQKSGVKKEKEKNPKEKK